MRAGPSFDLLLRSVDRIAGKFGNSQELRLGEFVQNEISIRSLDQVSQVFHVL